MEQSNNMTKESQITNNRLRIVLFSIFASCILIISIAFFTLSTVKPYIGVVLSRGDTGWAVDSVDPNGLANQAGRR